MHVTINREKLLAAYISVSAAVPTKPEKLILTNILLDVTENSVYLYATDGVMVGVEVKIPDCVVQEAGSVLIESTKIGPILRNSFDKELVLKSTGSGILIKGERSKFTVPTSDPAAFPKFLEFDASKYHEIPVSYLKTLLGRALTSAGKHTKLALNSVLLECTDQEIIAVGSDSTSVSKVAYKATIGGEHRTGTGFTLVADRAVQLILKALQGVTSKITCTTNAVFIRSEDMSIYSLLLVGDHVKWRKQVEREIPEGSLVREFNTEELLIAVRQAAVAQDQEGGISLTFGENKVVLSGMSQDQSEVVLPLDYDGPELKFNVSATYLTDFLTAAKPNSLVTMVVTEYEHPETKVKTIPALRFSTADGYHYLCSTMGNE